jgi:hypothetical protein
VEAKAVAENQSKNVEVEMNVHGGMIYGMIGKNTGHITIQPSEKRQTLAEAAAEIQELLKQLDQSYPSHVTPETKAEIDVAVMGISKDPTLRQKAIAALKAGGIEALKELADNPYVNILIAAWEGWKQR